MGSLKEREKYLIGLIRRIDEEANITKQPIINELLKIRQMDIGPVTLPPEIIDKIDFNELPKIVYKKGE